MNYAESLIKKGCQKKCFEKVFLFLPVFFFFFQLSSAVNQRALSGRPPLLVGWMHVCREEMKQEQNKKQSAVPQNNTNVIACAQAGRENVASALQP